MGDLQSVSIDESLDLVHSGMVNLIDTDIHDLNATGSPSISLFNSVVDTLMADSSVFSLSAGSSIDLFNCIDADMAVSESSLNDIFIYCFAFFG